MDSPRTHVFPYLVLLTAVSFVVSLYLVFFATPVERTMGMVQRIFYFHVSSAWVAFLAFFVAFVAGIAYLIRRGVAQDMIGVGSLEIGILFSTIALVTGSLWARPVWNTWWTWDPRLTSTLVMWIYYTATWLLRRMMDDAEQRARFSAILNIIGFINVPIVFLAIRLWRTIHPVILTSEGFAMEPAMVVALLSSILTFTLLYGTLLQGRLRVERLDHEVARLEYESIRQSRGAR